MFKKVAIWFVSLAAILYSTVGASPAHANLIDQARSFLQLPQEVDKLKAQYAEMQRQYEQTAAQLEEAKNAALRYEQEQRQLLEQNRQLQRQNEELTRTVQDLRDAERKRNRNYNIVRNAAIGAAGLLLLVFASSRVLRVALRSSR